MATYPLSGVAYEIYDELGSPTTPTTGRIFNWLEFNAGKLNNEISTIYEAVSGDYFPQLGVDEKDILKALYYQDYYKKKVGSVLDTAQTSNILSLKDDKSSVTFLNSNESSKIYRNLAQDYGDEVMVLSNLYKHNRSGPRDPEENITGYLWSD